MRTIYIFLQNCIPSVFMNDINATFRLNVRKALTEKGLHASDIQKALGCSQSKAQRLTDPNCVGQVSLEDAVKIAELLDVSITMLSGSHVSQYMKDGAAIMFEYLAFICEFNLNHEKRFPKEKLNQIQSFISYIQETRVMQR